MTLTYFRCTSNSYNWNLMCVLSSSVQAHRNMIQSIREFRMAHQTFWEELARLPQCLSSATHGRRLGSLGTDYIILREVTNSRSHRRCHRSSLEACLAAITLVVLYSKYNRLVIHSSACPRGLQKRSICAFVFDLRNFHNNARISTSH